MTMLLHIGAGNGDDLGAWLARDLSDIILIEPNPECRKPLAEAAGRDPRVDIVEAAIAPADGEAPLHVFNMAAQSSLRRPTGLSALFPGLREVGTPTVETLSVDRLLDRAGLPDGNAAAMVLDAPGLEYDILVRLAELGALTRFREISLHGTRTACFEGGRPIGASRGLLEAEGFVLADKIGNDPDFPVLLMRLDPDKAEIIELRKALERRQGLDARLSAAEASAAETRERLTAAHKTLENQTRARLAAIEALQAVWACLGDAERHRRELDDALTDLSDFVSQAAQAGQAVPAEEVRERVGRVQVFVNALARILSGGTQRAEAERIVAQSGEWAKATLAETPEAAAKADLPVQTKGQTAGGAHAGVAQRDAEEDAAERIETLQDDLSRSLKLQALQKSDLQDLQRRYRDLAEAKQAQERLLSQLAARMAAAARQLGAEQAE